MLQGIAIVVALIALMMIISLVHTAYARKAEDKRARSLRSHG